MSELFQPITADQLFRWVFTELDTRDSIFGIPRRHFYVPRDDAPYRTEAFGRPLETPFGPAAGPHTQMAQNIVAAWLCGARYIELKTVQTLDELDIARATKPGRDDVLRHLGVGACRRSERCADTLAKRGCSEALVVTRHEEMAAGNPKDGVAGFKLSKNPRKYLIRSYWLE